MWSHVPSTKRLLALPVMALLLFNVAVAGTAIAAPNIWVVSANVDRDTTLVGESVPVTVHLKNTRDGGVIGVDVSANGSVVTRERFQVESDSERTVKIPLTLNDPGRYKIKANDRNAGWLTVTRIRVASVTDVDGGRSVLLSAGNASAGTELTAALPEAPNASVSLQRVRMTASGESFNRSITTYSTPENAPFDVPDNDDSAVVGAIGSDAVTDVRTTSLRIAIDRDTIREHDLQTDDVTVYARSNGSYVPLATDQTATTTERVVYEAETDGGNQFVVGSLAPQFAVRSEQITTATVADGKQINLTATVANDGPVRGEFTTEMRVNGETVDERTIPVPAGESKTITLQHTVTESGDYAVSLGDRSVGSVVLTGDASSSDGAGTDDATESTGSTDDSTETDVHDEGGFLDAEPSLPSLDDISPIELAVGAGIVVLGGALLLFARR